MKAKLLVLALLGAALPAFALSNWHVGPFFEYRHDAAPQGDATFWALRPFYAQVRDAGARTTADDALWPLVSYRSHADAAWWHAVLLAFGDTRDNDPPWSFNVVPFWSSGADRQGNGYWGFFPFYGHHPHVFLVDDWDYVLWPIWHTYTVKDVRSRAVLWPFVTWREAPREGFGVWPFYGAARLRESHHHYALWPLVTWAHYDEDRDTSGAGTSWWALPFYGEVRRARERQTLILPPFFSYTKTPVAKRLRVPWPLVDLEASTTRDRISIWPLWEQLRGYSYATNGHARATGPVEERTWRVGWKLIEHTVLATERTREMRFSFFPFLTWEKRERLTAPDAPAETYFRFWPFYSAETKRGRTRQRALELIPIRGVDGLERTWAPFWTLWSRDERPDGHTYHTLLWNFFFWRTSR